MFAGPNNNGYNNNYQPQQYGYGQQPQQAPAAKLSSIDDLLSGSGAKAFFNADSQIGASVTGVVDLVETVQAHDFQTKQPAFWNDGRPQMQIHIVLQTTLRDPSVDDDDGRRSLWIKGWGIQLKAFREACKQAGGNPPKNGDTMTATFSGLGERGNAPQAPKVYEYRIVPANGVNALVNPQQPVQQAVAQPQQGYYQPAQQPAYSQPQPQQQQPIQQTQVAQPQQMAVNPQQVLQLKAAGKAPQEIAGLLGTTLQQVLAITDAANPMAHSGREDEPEF
jgi:hypothetical protein